MAIALILALVGAIILHWSDWYGTETGFTGIALILLASCFFVAAFVVVCVNI